MSEQSSLPSVAGGFAPVILFAYNRPLHLARTVTSLLANAEAASTHLTIYCDAPKHLEHSAAADEVRRYVDSITGFASVNRIYRTQNLGLAKSIVEGVTQTLRLHDRVIILEDDLLLSPHFLRYMNDGLTCYQHDEGVASIHGYWYPTNGALPETFFLKGADCWGWATWSRAWAHFDADSARLLRGIRERNLAHEIDYDGSYPHMSILKRQIAGRNNSWAIQWHVSCYLANMLTLYPSRSLVANIGHDSSGTHCAASDIFSDEVAQYPVHVERIEMAVCDPARAAAISFFRQHKNGPFQKALRYLHNRLGAIQNRSRASP